MKGHFKATCGCPRYTPSPVDPSYPYPYLGPLSSLPRSQASGGRVAMGIRGWVSLDVDKVWVSRVCGGAEGVLLLPKANVRRRQVMQLHDLNFQSPQPLPSSRARHFWEAGNKRGCLTQESEKSHQRDVTDRVIDYSREERRRGWGGSTW